MTRGWIGFAIAATYAAFYIAMAVYFTPACPLDRGFGLGCQRQATP